MYFKKAIEDILRTLVFVMVEPFNMILRFLGNHGRDTDF
jgi:hypothetical protein